MALLNKLILADQTDDVFIKKRSKVFNKMKSDKYNFILKNLYMLKNYKHPNQRKERSELIISVVDVEIDQFILKIKYKNNKGRYLLRIIELEVEKKKNNHNTFLDVIKNYIRPEKNMTNPNDEEDMYKMISISGWLPFPYVTKKLCYSKKNRIEKYRKQILFFIDLFECKHNILINPLNDLTNIILMFIS